MPPKLYATAIRGNDNSTNVSMGTSRPSSFCSTICHGERVVISSNPRVLRSFSIVRQPQLIAGKNR